MILIFTFLDFLSLLILLTMHFQIAHSWRFGITAITYLIAKTIMFKEEPFVIVDLLLAIYLILMLIFKINWFITWIFIIFYAQRIFVSIIAK